MALEQAQADGQLARNNLFADYCVHDARPTGAVPDYSTARPGQLELASRQFTVWLWRVSHFPRVALCVQPRLNTTVKQFVGLVFWQYFNQLTRADAPPGLFDDLDRFDSTFLDRISVYILDTPEENVDSEFPPLDPTDPIHKYEFDSLALIEHTVTRKEDTKSKEVPLVLVTV
ncbi:unnamed protein product [Echinostoma caproni]|uniref:CRIM domain-containing protein n=1 Tax=Echinostoma caproni TaxID=27848 RepID=A0A3P8IIR4_9TREM|nr:unnamed protein product [Echinostoma caproni]